MKELTITMNLQVTKVIRMFDEEMADNYIQNLRTAERQGELKESFTKALEADDVNISNVKVFAMDIEEE